MIKLFNRLAWFICIILGLVTMLVFFSFSSKSYYGDAGFSILFFGIILGFIYKTIFLPHQLIVDNIVEYTNKVINRAASGNSINKNAQSQTVEKQENNILQEVNSGTITSQNAPFPQNTFYKDYAETIDIARESIIEEDEEDEEDEHEYEYISQSQYEEPVKDNHKYEIREPNFIERFFSENVIAKIGGILLFLGVLFLLGLVYDSAGPILKLILGFAIGFIIFVIGVVLDKKGFSSESRILLGVGILINYLVILSGRYLIGDSVSSVKILTEGTTFIFLILNTIFAIVTSMVYKSKTLMLFSFVFAFFNPFLIGAASNGTPFTLVGYGAIVALGAFFLAHNFYKEGETSFARYLLNTGFIGSNLLFMIAPITTSAHWVFKLVFVVLLGLIATYIAYKNSEKDLIRNYFVGIYITFAVLLGHGAALNILNTGVAFIGYILFLGFALLMSAFAIVIGTVSMGILLFVPILFVFVLLITGNLFFIVPVILGTLLSYLIVFVVLFNSISSFLRYIFFVILGVFLMLSNVALPQVMHAPMDSVTHISTIIAGLIFLFSAYYFSKKEAMGYLYTIGTIGTISILVPIIQTQGILMNNSIIAIVIFGLTNILLPFFNKNICYKDLKNLSIALITGIIFVAGELYNFGEIAGHFPGITLGYAFMGLAILYFILGYAMSQVIDFGAPNDKEANEDKLNVIYSYLGTSISLFSIAVLIIFSKTPAIIASIWLFEATILFFFYNKTKDIKVYIGAIILFFIGLLKFGIFAFGINEGDYISLVSIVIIFASFVVNLYLLKDDKSESRTVHDSIHVVALILLGIGVNNIVPHTGMGYSAFAICIIMLIIGIIYDLLASALLGYIFLFGIGIFYIYHVGSIDDVFDRLENMSRPELKGLQYLIPVILGTWLFFRKDFQSKLSQVTGLLNISYMVYLFLITSLFVYNIFHNTFALTIYWAVWAYLYLSTGIKNDYKKYRTIGLYILSLVVVKIIFYDIWYGIESSIARVVALMFVGAMMVFISTLYSRKYSSNLAGEFSFDFGGNKNEDFDLQNEINNSSKKEFLTNKALEKISIGNLESVTFIMGEKTIKSKIVNLIKIAKIITTQFNKTSFLPGELNGAYDELYNNYKAQVSASEYKKITTAMKEFSEHGGDIILK